MRIILIKLLTFGIVAVVAGPAQAATRWDLAFFGSPAFRVAGEQLAECVGEKSGGEFTIKTHAGTLSKSTEVLDNLAVGAFQLGYVVTSYHPGKNPLMSVLDLPFLPIETMEQRRDMAEKLFANAKIKAEFARWNTVPVMAVVQPNYELIGRGNPLTKLDDFQNRRIKATSGIGDALSRFGASLVPVTGSEQYNALQTGVIDAVAATPSAFGGWKLYEISEWYTVGMQAGSAHVTIAANIDAYRDLTESERKTLDECKSVAYAATIEAQSKAEEKYRPAFEKNKLQRIDIPAEMLARLRREAAEPVWKAWIESVDGQEIFDLVTSGAN